MKAYEEEKFQDFLKNIDSPGMGIYDEESDEFLLKWQSVTSWLLYDSGVTEISPEEFGIPRP